jgi:DNA-binding response OmpR family regulator
MSPAPCNVLVVDDHKDCADSAAMLLQAWGHHVYTAYTPEEALRLAWAIHPDVILMDIGLPGKDGFELGKEIQPVCPESRIIALTGFGQADISRRSQEAGFDQCLVKPVDPDVLIHAVEGDSHG